MTEPDPIAALAAQLEELRGQIGALRARHSEDYGQVMVLLLEIKKLGEKIDAASARRNADEPQAPYWLGLSKEEHAARLAEGPSLGRARCPRSVPHVLWQAAALLGQPRRARARDRQHDDGMGADLRRPG